MSRSYCLATQLQLLELQRFLSSTDAKTRLLRRSPNLLALKHYRRSVNGFAATAKSTLTEGRCGLHSLRPAKDSSPPESDRRRGGLPKELSRSVMVLTCESSAGDGVCDVYLIGTFHGSLDSSMEVEAVVRYLKPQVLTLFETQFSSNVNGFNAGRLLGVMLMSSGGTCTSGFEGSFVLDATVANENAVASSIEFRVAFKEAMKYGGRVILGDRPMMITLLRTWGKMNLWYKIKLICASLFPSFFFPSVVELSKKDVFDVDGETFMQEMGEEFPTLMETIVNERDQYMASILLRIAREHTSVVAVVGKGHLAGIKKHWKQPVAMKDLMSIPAPHSTISPEMMKKLLHFI